MYLFFQPFCLPYSRKNVVGCFFGELVVKFAMERDEEWLIEGIVVPKETYREL